MTKWLGAPAAFAVMAALALGGIARGMAETAEGAPVPVTGAADPLVLLQDDDPTLRANKHLVFDMWRGIVNAGHIELADKFLREDYMQHSPVLPTGREAFKKIFSAVPRLDAIPDLVQPPLVTIFAEGDRVVMTLAETLQEPDRTGTYTTTHFNMFRIKDGRLAEHWHSVQAVPGPDVLPPGEGGPLPVHGVTGAAQLSLLQAKNPEAAANKRLIFNMWREVMDAGREELANLYFAEGYEEHGPTAATGRAALKKRIAMQPDLPIQTFLDASVVSIVAEGDLVTVVTKLEHPYPGRPGATYTTAWFDMFRIDGGLIVEHWNPAIKPGSPANEY